MEAAASCVEKVKSVTVIGRDTVPFRRVLGEEIGARLMALFKEKNVLFRMQSGVARFLAGPSGDTVSQVELTDGSTLPADICVLGLGSSPATKFLDGSGVNMDKSGAIIVNKVMHVLFYFTLFYLYKVVLCMNVWTLISSGHHSIILSVYCSKMVILEYIHCFFCVFM